MWELLVNLLGYLYLFIFYFLDNVVAADKLLHNFAFMAISNASFSVDSFFLLR